MASLNFSWASNISHVALFPPNSCPLSSFVYINAIRMRIGQIFDTIHVVNIVRAVVNYSKELSLVTI